jgi:hypothetical protein
MQGRSNSNKNWKLPREGGWLLNPGKSDFVDVPSDFEAGRFWGRTGCKTTNGQFNCDTGNCGPFLKCASGGVQRGG